MSQEHPEAPADAPEGRRVRIIIGALMLAMLLAALDQTIVSTALPTIVGELGGLEHLSWVVTSYPSARRCWRSGPTGTSASARTEGTLVALGPTSTR